MLLKYPPPSPLAEVEAPSKGFLSVNDDIDPLLGTQLHFLAEHLTTLPYDARGEGLLNGYN